MAHKVQFKVKKGPDKGKTIKFTAKGPSPKEGGKHPNAKVGDVIKFKTPAGCTAESKYTGRGKTGWKIENVSCPAGVRQSAAARRKKGKKKGKSRKKR